MMSPSLRTEGLFWRMRTAYGKKPRIISLVFLCWFPKNDKEQVLSFCKSENNRRPSACPTRGNSWCVPFLLLLEIFGDFPVLGIFFASIPLLV